MTGIGDPFVYLGRVWTVTAVHVYPPALTLRDGTETRTVWR